jgi:hypothetical protein
MSDSRKDEIEHGFLAGKEDSYFKMAMRERKRRI